MFGAMQLVCAIETKTLQFLQTLKVETVIQSCIYSNEIVWKSIPTTPGQSRGAQDVKLSQE